MSGKTRVLQVAYDLTMGGVPADIMYPARILDKDEVEFDVLLTSDNVGFYDEEFRKYGNIYRIPIKLGRNKIARAIRVFTDPIYIYVKTKKFLKAKKGYYDAIHCRNFEFNAPCVAAAHKVGIPVRISHSHVNAPAKERPHIALYNYLSRKIIKKHATMCLGVTQGALEYMIGKNGHGYVIKNPTVDLTKFDPTKYEYPEHNDIHLIMVGSIQPRKNQMFGAEVLNELVKAGQDAKMIFIGYPTRPESGYLESVQEFVKDNNLNERGYLIYHAVGTQDAVKSQSIDMAEEMLERSDVFTPEHYMFHLKDGGYHDFDAVQEYLYNALPLFFRDPDNDQVISDAAPAAVYTKDTGITEVQSDPAFGDYGRLIFPVDNGYMSGNTLGNLRLTWYSNIDPDKTVEICNYLKSHAEDGETVFYDIYSEEEKAADPAKEDTGLFFFRGDPGAKFAIVNAGGGFAYVGAMHDSFPHALELSKRGYNAFALIYRPGAQTACEDLARAIAFVFDHAEELQVDTSDYSLWGGSAGARMAAWLGSYGTESFGEDAYPRPAALFVNYTGLSEVYGNEPPTYSAVGTSDGIASYRTMERRIQAIQANGTDAEIEVFNGLSHGFGLGTGTVAEGWIDRAVEFWERNMKNE